MLAGHTRNVANVDFPYAKEVVKTRHTQTALKVMPVAESVMVVFQFFFLRTWFDMNGNSFQ